MLKKLFFSEDRLAYFSGGPSHAPKPTDANEAKETQKEIPHNKEKLNEFVETELITLDANKVENFAKEMKGKSGNDVNQEFFTDVLGFKKDYISKQGNEKVAVVIKGFQEQLKSEFPKAGIKIDGKLGPWTLSVMSAKAAVENTDHMTEEGIMPDSMSAQFDTIDQADIASFKKVKGWENQNMHVWIQVLQMDVPKAPEGSKDKDFAKKYVAKEMKNLQKYLARKVGVDMKADGKFGKQSMQVFEKFLKQPKAKPVESVTDKKPKLDARTSDIAGAGAFKKPVVNPDNLPLREMARLHDSVKGKTERSGIIDDLDELSIESQLRNLNPKEVANCKKQPGNKKNEYFWKNVLSLKMPKGDNVEVRNLYIQNKVKDLQKYLNLEANAKLKPDGKIGSKTLDALMDFSNNMPAENEDVPKQKVAKAPKPVEQAGFDEIPPNMKKDFEAKPAQKVAKKPKPSVEDELPPDHPRDEA